MRRKHRKHIYLGLPSFCSSLHVSLTLLLLRLLSHSVSIPPLLWQTAPPAFFMFGCCRRGINLLFVAVNQISTDRFKLIASVSWSQKKTVLQAVISFYSPSDILINDMHTQYVSYFIFHFKWFWHIYKIYLTPAEFVMPLYLCKMQLMLNDYMCASFMLRYLNICIALMHKWM